ncbi:nuclear GTPase SLIP-GC-like, partial [Engraulis encrasicolus]|uniref:nuclear GTPase SLIP-GC-like n=1 Tax=Engraulis encrasicolus TaxID=184585 RepID=UPI002FCF6629
VTTRFRRIEDETTTIEVSNLFSAFTDMSKSRKWIFSELYSMVNFSEGTSIQDLLKTPTQTTTIGLFGQTGCGKSSLLNTLLGEPDLLPTGQLEACTSVIIQVEAKSEDNNYKATIDFISEEEWHKELKGLLEDLEEDRTSSISQMAEDKVSALYGSDATSKSFDELATALSDEIQPYIMADESGQLFWPIVKTVKIEVPKWKHLPENIVLVDLPGNGDHNQSRDEMWKKMLSQCRVVWIVSAITRPASDNCAWEIFETNRNDMVQGGECTSIAFICTKTDDIDATSYMRNEKLKDEDLPGITSDSERERACILHRNKKAKDKTHDINVDISVFTVSSHEFDSQKHLEEKDTEIPLLKEELDRFNNRKQFVSSASGILHLIQAGAMNKDRSKLHTELLKILRVELDSLRRTLQTRYDQLKQKLFEGVQKAKESRDKVLQNQLSAPRGKGGGFHRTLSALCRSNGYFRSRGETRDVNQALAQAMQNSIDEEFNRLFPKAAGGMASIKMKGEQDNQYGKGLKKTGQSIQERIDEFTICSINVNQGYKEPEAVLHILKFLKGKEAKLKEKAHTDIMDTKKAMYASIRETIKQQMTPGYEKADKVSGKGSMEKKRTILVEHASSAANQMFDRAKDKMLEKFTGLMDRIEADFKNTLEEAVRHALKESPFTFSINVESQIKRMKALSEQLCCTKQESSNTISWRSCQTCAHIQEPGDWCVLQPFISLENGGCQYTVSSAAGSYECSESGLRWSCAVPVTLQYLISKEELFWAQMKMLRYQPAGPLMELKLLSGELEEVHLPHALCLGGSDPAVLGDAVRALHGNDSGVSLETCKLSRFHCRLLAPHFSLWQLAVKLGFPVKSHCEVLIYEHCPRPLVLHTFLLPLPSSARQKVKERWRGRGIIKPSPDHAILVGSTVQLHTSSDSLEVTPSEVTLSYRNPPTFFEVYLGNSLPDFKMEIKTVEKHTVWEAVLRQGIDYYRTQEPADTAHVTESNTDEPPQPSRIPGQVGSLMAAAFLEEKRPKLIQRVTEVMPIADQLLSKGVIGQETYANIQAAATSQDKMRLLFEGLHSAGVQGKLAFYTILQEQLPHLVDDLTCGRCVPESFDPPEIKLPIPPIHT